MAKVVVTGGGGFIGSHIVEALLARGDDVHVVDTFVTGKKENLTSVRNSIGVHQVDIRDTEKLTELFRGADVVYHQAAIPSVPKSISEPRMTHEINVTGTLSVFIAARDASVRRVVYASSSAVYGDTPVLPKVETLSMQPKSPYGVQKMMGEVYAQLCTDLYGVETVGLRYFNVFGPRQDPNSEYSAVIPKFISLMKQGKSPVIFGDGAQTRDFTFIDTVVDANLKAGNAGGIRAEIMNIAGGEQISLNQLVEEINVQLGTSLSPQYESPRVGDIKDSYADISKAKQVIGFEQKISFKDGLKKTIISL